MELYCDMLLACPGLLERFWNKVLQLVTGYTRSYQVHEGRKGIREACDTDIRAQRRGRIP